MKILILGAGRVGSAMAEDLRTDTRFKLTLADINEIPLKKFKGSVIHADLSKPRTITDLAKKFDLVLNAVPGFMGFKVFKTVIESGTDIVDIAFFPEDPFLVDELAQKRGVVAVMDSGVAPGLSNLLVGHAARKLDSLLSVKIYVGGLPLFRDWPYEYRAVFSPLDVIEEYTRPARFRQNGELIVKDALTDRELLTFQRVGTLEAFNTDGLRTLLKTVHCPDMVEKTLRYPGHVDKMLLLRESGFFSSNPIQVKGKKIKPLDVTAHLLFPMWELKQGEEDITVMRVEVDGKKGKSHIKYLFNLFDRFDVQSQTTSMSRTTGYTATMVVRLIREGLFRVPGISPPEKIGESEECVNYILQGLREKGIIVDQQIQVS